MEGREEAGCGLEVSGGDATEVFEAVEEALDAVAFPAKRAVPGPGDTDVRLAADVGRCPGGLDNR